MSAGTTTTTNSNAATKNAAVTSASANPSKPPVAKSSSWRNLAGLWPYLKRYPGGIALGMLCLLLTSLIGNIIPLTTGVITDVVAGNPRPFQSGAPNEVTGSLAHWIPFYAPHSRHAIGIYCLILLVCVLLKGFFSFCTRWILIGVSRDIEFDIRVSLFDRLLVMEPEFYVRNRTGELMSRATNDLNNVRMVLGPGIMYTGQTLATMVLALFVLARLSSSLTLWILLPVPIVFVSVRHFGKVIHDLYEKIQASLASLSAKVQENLAGVRVVRAYAQEEAEIRGFDEPNREYVARNIKLIRTWSMFMPSLQALIGTSFLIVLWKGGDQLLSGRITLGALIAFYTYLGLLVWPMIALGWVTNIFQRGAAKCTGRLNYILRAKPQIDDSAATVSKQTKVTGEVEFRDLTFTYPTNLAGNAANTGSTAGATAGKTNGSGTSAAVSTSGLARHQSQNPCRFGRSRSSARPEAAKPLSPRLLSLAFGKPPMVNSSSTVTRSANGRSKTSAARSATCRRTRISSAKPSAAISPSVSPNMASIRSAPPLKSRTSTPISKPSAINTTRSSANAASLSPAAKNSAAPSRAPSSATHAF